MDSFKNKLLIIFCIFVVITPFWLVKGFCAEVENVDFNIANDLFIVDSQNYFTAYNGINVGYFQLQKGYIYYITNNSSAYPRNLAFSNELPSVNVPYSYIGSIPSGGTYSYLASDNSYLYFCFANSTEVVVTRERVESMNGAVSDLVNNVGMDSIWNIFDIGINYIIVVVVVAFGLFIIFSLIRKLTKGKEGF